MSRNDNISGRAFDAFSGPMVADWEVQRSFGLTHKVTYDGPYFNFFHDDPPYVALRNLNVMPIYDIRRPTQRHVYRIWSGSLEYGTSLKVNGVAYAISEVQKTNEVLRVIRAPKTDVYNIYRESFYHGTSSEQLDSLLHQPPMNMGNNRISGPGICGVLKGDIDTAKTYASNARQKYGFESKAIVAEASFNPHRKLDIGVIRLKDRDIWRNSDMLQGVFRGDWSIRNPYLLKAIHDNYDVLYVLNAAQSNYASLPDKFMVVTPRAGKGALVWDRYAVVSSPYTPSEKWQWYSVVSKESTQRPSGSNRFLTSVVMPAVTAYEYSHEYAHARSLGCYDPGPVLLMTGARIAGYSAVHMLPELVMHGASAPISILGGVSEAAYALEQRVKPEFKSHCEVIDRMVEQGATNQQIRDYVRMNPMANPDVIGQMAPFARLGEYVFTPAMSAIHRAFADASTAVYTASRDFSRLREGVQQEVVANPTFSNLMALSSLSGEAVDWVGMYPSPTDRSLSGMVVDWMHQPRRIRSHHTMPEDKGGLVGQASRLYGRYSEQSFSDWMQQRRTIRPSHAVGEGGLVGQVRSLFSSDPDQTSQDFQAGKQQARNIRPSLPAPESSSQEEHDALAAKLPIDELDQDRLGINLEVPPIDHMPTSKHFTQLGFHMQPDESGEVTIELDPSTPFMKQLGFEQVLNLVNMAGIYNANGAFSPIEIDLSSLSTVASGPVNLTQEQMDIARSFIAPTPGVWNVDSGTLPRIEKITLDADSDGIKLAAGLAGALGGVSIKLNATATAANMTAGITVKATAYFGPKFLSTLATTTGYAAIAFVVVAGIAYGLNKYNEHVQRKLNRGLMDANASCEVVADIMRDLNQSLGADIEAHQMKDLLNEVRKAKGQLQGEIAREMRNYNQASKYKKGKNAAKKHAQILKSYNSQLDVLKDIESDLNFKIIKNDFIDAHQTDTPDALIKLIDSHFNGKQMTIVMQAQAEALSILVRINVVSLLKTNDVETAMNLVKGIKQSKTIVELGRLPKFSFHGRSGNKAKDVRKEQRTNLDKLNRLIDNVNQEVDQGGVPDQSRKELTNFIRDELLPHWHHERQGKKDKHQMTKLFDSLEDYLLRVLSPFEEACAREQCLFESENSAYADAVQFMSAHQHESGRFFVDFVSGMKKNSGGEYELKDQLIRELLPNRVFKQLASDVLDGNNDLKAAFSLIDAAISCMPEQKSVFEGLRQAREKLQGFHYRKRDENESAQVDEMPREAYLSEMRRACQAFLSAAKPVFNKGDEILPDSGDALILTVGREIYMSNLRHLAMTGDTKLVVEQLQILKQYDSDNQVHYAEIMQYVDQPANDSWGGPESLRFLGGRRAFKDRPDSNTALLDDYTEDEERLPRSYADQDTYKDKRAQLIEQLGRLLENPDHNRKEAEKLSFKIAVCDGQLGQRVRYLLERGYYQHAISLIEQLNANTSALNLSSERMMAVHSLKIQLTGYVVGALTRLIQAELRGCNRGVCQQGALALLEFINRIESLVPNALMLKAHAMHEARYSSATIAQGSHTDAWQSLYIRLFTPSLTYPTIMLYGQIASSVFAFSPMLTEPTLRFVGVHQATRQQIVRCEQTAGRLTGYGLNMLQASNSAAMLYEMGVCFTSSVSSLAHLFGLGRDLYNYMNESSMAAWGLLPEDPAYYISKLRNDAITSCAGLSVSAWMALGSAGTLSLPFMLFCAGAAINVFGIYRASSNGTAKASAEQVIDAALKNIHVMEALKFELMYLSNVHYVLLPREPNGHVLNKIKRGEYVGVYEDHQQSSDEMSWTSSYVLYSIDQSNKGYKVTRLSDKYNKLLGNAFRESEPRYAKASSQREIQRITFPELITNRLYANYLDAAEIKFINRGLSEDQLAEIRSGRVIYIANNHAGKYLLHFCLSNDVTNKSIQTVELGSNGANSDGYNLLLSVNWDQAQSFSLNVMLLEGIACDCRESVRHVLLSYIARSIADLYISRSQEKLKEMIETYFGGCAYDSGQSDIVNMARVLSFVQELHELNKTRPGLSQSPDEVILSLISGGQRSDDQLEQERLSNEVEDQLLERTKPTNDLLVGATYKMPLRYCADVLVIRMQAYIRKIATKMSYFNSPSALSEDTSELIDNFKADVGNYMTHLHQQLSSQYQVEWASYREKVKSALRVFYLKLIDLASLSSEVYRMTHRQAFKDHVLLCLLNAKEDITSTLTWKSIMTADDSFRCAALLLAVGNDAEAKNFFEHVKDNVKALLSDKSDEAVQSCLNLLIKRFGIDDVLAVLDDAACDNDIICKAIYEAADQSAFDKLDKLLEQHEAIRLPAYVQAKIAHARHTHGPVEALAMLLQQKNRDHIAYWHLLKELLGLVIDQAQWLSNDDTCQLEAMRYLNFALKFSYEKVFAYQHIDADNISNRVMRASYTRIVVQAKRDFGDQYGAICKFIQTKDAGYADNQLLKFLFEKLSEAGLTDAQESSRFIPINPRNGATFLASLGLNESSVVNKLMHCCKDGDGFNAGVYELLLEDGLNLNEANACRLSGEPVVVFRAGILPRIRDYIVRALDQAHPPAGIVNAICRAYQINIQVMRLGVSGHLEPDCRFDCPGRSNLTHTILKRSSEGQYRFLMLEPLPERKVQQLSHNAAALMRAGKQQSLDYRKADRPSLYK